MQLNFSANLSFMFTAETDQLPNRYQLAKDAGFRAVECAWPYDYSVEVMAKAREATGLHHVLINTCSGGPDIGGFGLGALPGRQEDFKEQLELTIKYAKGLKCPRVRVMASKLQGTFKEDEMLRVYKDNLLYAADRLAKENIVAMIEPCNPHSMPGYLINHPQKAIDCIEELKHPNIKLQLDIFHLQQMEGNLTRNIIKYLPYVEHIQIAQVPDRHEPDSEGEINYKYVFDMLKSSNYHKWVGLEYKPIRGTVDGLKWVKEMGYTL